MQNGVCEPCYVQDYCGRKASILAKEARNKKPSRITSYEELGRAYNEYEEIDELTQGPSKRQCLSGRTDPETSWLSNEVENSTHSRTGSDMPCSCTNSQSH